MELLDIIMEYAKVIIDYLMANMVVLNLIFAIIIVFFQRRDPKSVWTWLLLLYFIPILGFIFYLFVGTDMHKRKMFRVKEIEDRLNEAIRQQENSIRNKEIEKRMPEITGFSDVAMYNLDTMSAVLSDDNDIDIFTDGNKKFDALITDIKEAKEFIHIQYYIIKNDLLFQRIVEVLKEKAKEGVKVRILYDGMGSRFVRKKYWKELRKEGILVAEFFKPSLGRANLRINYRNHRKIVVIDNKIAYVGGFNIGKEYIGLDKKFGYWRDTHLRLKGSAVQGLQIRFLLDWNYASKESLLNDINYIRDCEPGTRDKCEVQIIYSGPDCTLPNIRNNYVQLINKAKKNIYIQTPYFIPDEPLMNALLIAIHSGIEVSVMIPCKPDHPFVYWATYSYVGELIMAGAKCYIYENGFLHSKGIIVDDKVFCYGTANMDIRSFSLNFEVNATVYDEMKSREMAEIFRKDIEESTLLTKEKYLARNLKIRLKEQVCRLLSPLL